MRQLFTTSLWRGLGLAIGLLAAASVPAQVIDDANAGIQFSFTTPGTRGLAMGGAFIGLADDASAAVLNPAGLTALEGSQVSLEARDAKYFNLFTKTGHGFGPASYYGSDNVEGLVYGKDANYVRNLDYLSYVYAGRGWGVAAYHYLPAKFSADFKTQGAWVGEYSYDPALSTIDRLYPAKVSLDLKATATGLAVAFDLGKRFSVGVGAAYWQLQLDSLSQHFYFSHDTTPPPPGRIVLSPNFYAPASFAATDVFSSQVQHADDHAVAFNAGLLWRVTDSLSVGGSYRQGTEYDLTYARSCGPKQPQADEPQCSPASSAGKFAVPSVFGIGFAYKPVAGMSITLDWDRVAYSEMTDHVTGPPEYAGERNSFKVDDANEVHAGFEYVFLNLANPISVRGGISLDPAHQMAYRGSSEDPLLRAMWAAAEQAKDQDHLSAGVGWLIRKHLTLDIGVDVSDRLDNVALQAGYRF